MNKSVAVFDIDGTLCDNTARIARLDPNNPDWDAFHAAQGEDEPIVAQMALLQMAWLSRYTVVLLTARHEMHRQATVEWLFRHKVHYHTLMMRTHDDINGDEFKRLALEQMLSQGFTIEVIVDDDLRVIEVARELDIPAVYIHSNYYDKSRWGTALAKEGSNA
jgi:uncharacterized HAD superfamily protein